MAYVRTKRVGERTYVYIVRGIRLADGRVRQETVRYIGPTDPVYGGRGPVDVQAEREKLKRRKTAR